MNVSLRPLEDGDLDAIYQQATDPESIRMAAFTAEDPADRRAFRDHMARVRANTDGSYQVVEVDGAVAGTIASFRMEGRLEVTYWADRAQWGKGSRARRCEPCSPRPPNGRCTPGPRRTTPARCECWRRPGSDASAWTAATPGRGEEIGETILRLD